MTQPRDPNPILFLLSLVGVLLLVIALAFLLLLWPGGGA